MEGLGQSRYMLPALGYLGIFRDPQEVGNQLETPPKSDFYTFWATEPPRHPVNKP